MIKQVIVLLTAIMALASSGAHAQNADETRIRQALQVKFPQMAIESIVRMPFGGLFEVILGGEVIYTDAKAEFILGGTLYDLRGAAPRNVTLEKMQKIAAKTIAASPENAIKMVRGNGKRVIYTFEDPNCGYCRELYKELAKMTDITVYTYLLPVLSPDSAEKSRAIWCAKDRVKAWDQMMVKGGLSEASKPCDTPLEKNSQIAQRLNIRGTPAIFLANGQQLGGFVPAQQIEQALAKQ